MSNTINAKTRGWRIRDTRNLRFHSNAPSICPEPVGVLLQLLCVWEDAVAQVPRSTMARRPWWPVLPAADMRLSTSHESGTTAYVAQSLYDRRAVRAPLSHSGVREIVDPKKVTR